MRRARPALWLALICAALGTSGAALAESCPQPFRASYEVEWHGMNAGTSTLELTRKGPHEYVYTSSNRARGLFRIALPGTITQVSTFSIVNGEVVPSSYIGDDGTSDTSRDVSFHFDWEARRVTGTAENKPVDQPLEPGVQDDLSVQIALMCALDAGHVPKSFRLIDKDGVREYQYTHEGQETVDTALGKLDTIIYKSQKAGSPRYTRMWIAPNLGYLPARAEQSRAGKRELQLTIRTFERPPVSAANASGS